MKQFKEISAEELNESPFKMIGKDWMLVAAEKEGKVNAMTASWGGLGVMWNKNVAYVFLRPQRYTKEFVDSSEKFSLSFYDASHRETLQYLGSVSGRQEDKMAKAGLTLLEGEDAPCFVEARAVLICRKMYAQKFGSECFVDKSVELPEQGLPYHVYC